MSLPKHQSGNSTNIALFGFLLWMALAGVTRVLASGSPSNSTWISYLPKYPGTPDADTRRPSSSAPPPRDQECNLISCGLNADCEGGACTCKNGYEGDPNKGCHYPEGHPCDSDNDCSLDNSCIENKCRNCRGDICDTDSSDDNDEGITEVPGSRGGVAARTKRA